MELLMTEQDKLEIDREIVRQLLEYREIVTVIVTGAKSDGANRAVLVSEY